MREEATAKEKLDEDGARNGESETYNRHHGVDDDDIEDVDNAAANLPRMKRGAQVHALIRKEGRLETALIMMLKYMAIVGDNDREGWQRRSGVIVGVNG